MGWRASVGDPLEGQGCGRCLPRSCLRIFLARAGPAWLAQPDATPGAYRCPAAPHSLLAPLPFLSLAIASRLSSGPRAPALRPLGGRNRRLRERSGRSGGGTLGASTQGWIFGHPPRAGIGARGRGKAIGASPHSGWTRRIHTLRRRAGLFGNALHGAGDGGDKAALVPRPAWGGGACPRGCGSSLLCRNEKFSATRNFDGPPGSTVSVEAARRAPAGPPLPLWGAGP